MTLAILRIGCSAALAGALLAAPPAHRPGHPALRKATFQGPALTPAGAADGRLELYAGKGGLERLVFTLHKADAPEGFAYLDSLRTFHFGDFEGPGAPAANRRLTTVTVPGPAGTVRVRLSQKGYYSAEVAGGFAFDTGVARPRARLDLQKIHRALKAGGTTLVVRVTDARNPKVWVEGRFPAAGMARTLDQHLASN